MKGEEFTVVHLVDVIARQYKHVIWISCTHDVQVLEYRIGRAPIPHFLYSLLSRQHVNEFAELAIQKTPAALNMLDQTV